MGRIGNIINRKGKQDAKRAKIFTKHARAIAVAAKEGGGNPDYNAALKTAIEKALISLESDKNRDTKIVQILSKQIKTGFFSNADIKSWIREAYDILGITDKVKATDLDRWFDCKPVAKWIDSKTVKGYEIYRPKIVFK